MKRKLLLALAPLALAAGAPQASAQAARAHPTPGAAARLLEEARPQLRLGTREGNERAAELYRQAVLADPVSAEARQGLGQAYIQRVQTYSLPRFWLDSAEVHLRRAVALDSLAPAPQLTLSSALFWRGRYAEVARMRRALYRRDPTPESASMLASILWHVGELPEALRLLEEVLPAYPGSAMARWHLGYVNWYLGRDEEAIRWFQRALEVNPAFPRAHTGIVNVLLSEGRADEARVQVERALREQPGEPEQLLNAGIVAVFAGDDRAALGYLERYREQAPGARRTPKPYLAHLYLRLGHAEEARRLLDELMDESRAAVEDGDRSWPLAYRMAQLHALRGDHDEGLRWLELAARGGWMEWGIASHDPLLAPLRDSPRFRAVMAGVRARADSARAAVGG